MTSPVVAIGPADTRRAVPALRVLWPRYGEEEMAALIDTSLRPNGYHLVGFLPADGSPAPCVLGYRFQHSLWLGKSLYIIDIATLPDQRGQGYAGRIMDWIEEEAARQNCAAVHLDSGVGPDRAAAHRLYMTKHYQIGCHHFVKKLTPPLG